MLTNFLILIAVDVALVTSNIALITLYLKVMRKANQDVLKFGLFVMWIAFGIALPLAVLGYFLQKFMIPNRHLRFFVIIGWILPTVCFGIYKLKREKMLK